MHLRIVLLVLVVALVSSVALVAIAATRPSGLPAYTTGYQTWPRLNTSPLEGGSPAHRGVKNVYASMRRVGRSFPAGTVVVKSIARPGDTSLRPSQVAVMRKRVGRWSFVEYRLSGARYAVLARGQLCVACHVQARKTDYVFTRG